MEIDFLKQKNLDILDGNLIIGGCNSVELAQDFKTPLYVTNEKTIRERYIKLENVLKKRYDKIRIHYALKANTNIQVLKILKELGSHVDVVSPGEVFLALRAGFNPHKILYTGNNFSNDDLIFALKKDIMINLDARSQINRLVRLLDENDSISNKRPLLSFRVNPEFGGGHHEHTITAGTDVKFGVLEPYIIEAYQKAMDNGFKEFGIHTHIGSGILDVKTFEIATNKYLSIVEKVAKELKIKFKFIDFGGGIGIPYRPQDKPLNLELYADKVITKFKDKMKALNLGRPYFCIEPGRYIVAESTILLSEVNTIKYSRNKIFVGVNAGFNILIRPTMYGSYHHVVVANKMNEKPQEIYQIAGNICESGDVLAKNRKLPKIEERDIIAFLDAGAYGYTMSSNYNCRLRPAEILVNEGVVKLIRKRDSFEDLLTGQILE
ncbi:MAG: diaminopimelate decarboxylase [Candidatus Helarchaeota archaeon]